MTTERPDRQRGPLVGLGVAAVLCCAVLPTALGAAAGTGVGGWLGIVVACLLAGAVALGLHLRARSRKAC
jgi:hypothetical protein